MKTRIAGALALLAAGLLGVFTLAGAPDAPGTIFTSLPPAPVDYVTDNARIFSDATRARLEARLHTFRDEHAFVRIYVYTLRSTNGPTAAAAMQELYRRWKMRDREIYDGLATVFVFWDEKKALVMLGQGAPPTSESALADLAPDLAAIFGDDPEGAVGRVIDRIGASLAQAESTSWLDSPPVPAEPSGPVHGNPNLADDAEVRALEDAVRRASTPAHPIVLALNPAKGLDGPEQRAAKLGRAWPDRIVLAVTRADAAVALVVPESLKDRFPDAQVQRIRREVDAAMTRATYARTLARVVGEIGMLAEGRTPPPWVAWQHPLKTLGGGEDEDPAPLALGVGIAVVALALLSFFLYMLVTDPKAVLLWIGVNLAEAVIGGAFGGGGGGSGGGGFSGGGGSFGGGGASGSW